MVPAELQCNNIISGTRRRNQKGRRLAFNVPAGINNNAKV